MRGCLTILMALTLFVVAPLSLLAFHTQSVLLNPTTYRQALREEKLRPALIEALAAGMTEGAPEEAIRPEQVKTLLEGLIPPGWIAEQVDRNLAAFIRWVDSDDPAPNVRIDLRPIKASLPQAILALAAAEWEKIPPCAEGEPPDLSEDLPSCRPPDMTVEEFPGASLSAEEIASEIPDELSLIDIQSDESGEGPVEALQGLRSLARASRLGSYAGLSISVLLLGLVALLSAFSRAAFFGRVGAVLLVVGLLSLGLVGILAAVAGLFSSIVSAALSEGPGALATLAGEVVGQVVGDIATPLLVESLLLAGVGTAMLVTRFVLGRRLPKPAV